MSIEGADFAYGRPGGAALVAAGKKFVCRYCPYPGDGGKGLTVAEIDDYHAHGIAICFVFETTAGRPLGGRTNGLQDAALALAGAQSIGWPDTRPIYFAMDEDINSTQYPLIDAYLTACAEVLGPRRVGIYGEFEVIEHCHAAGTAAYFWQAAAWSYHHVSDWLNIYQYMNSGEAPPINGASVDLDRAEGPDYGQWPLEATMEEELRLLNEAIVKRFNLIELASGDYNRMLKAWDACVSAGVIHVQPSPPDTWPPVVAVKPPTP